ncbi:hypothetical protein Tco_0418811 [Tanacetum coccineum]
MRCSTDESRCYRYTLDVQRMSQDAIVVHEMFNGGVEMLSLYIRCSTDESRCYRYTLDVQRMSRDAIVVHEMCQVVLTASYQLPEMTGPLCPTHPLEVSIKRKGQRKVDTLDTFQKSQEDWIRQYMEQQEEDEYESWEDTTDADDKTFKNIDVPAFRA